MNAEKINDVNEIYADTDYLKWDINSGEKTIHAHRIPGRFRTYQWIVSALIYGPYFLLPYLRWGDRQAFFLDIGNQKFYLAGIVVWPQDLWLLALLLLLSFVALFAMTAIAGRVFCGFMCPQSTWVNFLTSIEALVEGSAAKRYKLAAAPWGPEKIIKKTIKHSLWWVICSVTAITFIGYFVGIGDAWHNFFNLQYSALEWFTYGAVTLLFYVNCGFVREQVCMWICPYARIQGVLSDFFTKVVTYDVKRGEKRGKLKKNPDSDAGDCIDCNLCVAVCPTGVDIRAGYQLGCINCGLCTDACDDVMTQVGKPTGLIRFASQKEIETGVKDKHPFVNARPLLYAVFTLLLFVMIGSGLFLKSKIDLNVRHVRAPLYTQMSDGAIQNTYLLNFINKTEYADDFALQVSGIEGITTNADGHVFHLLSGQIKRFALNVKVPFENLNKERTDMDLKLRSLSNVDVSTEYQTMFIGPRS